MRIVRKEVLINNGSFTGKNQTMVEIDTAISKVTWPENSQQFTINPTPKGNGVKPIKNACMEYLESCGWNLEHRLQVLTETRPGPLDAVKTVGMQSFALEWETGNISSSHRAMNKMAVGMLERKLVGGALILPSRNLYQYLTDRVGNFQELSPYFTLYRSLNLQLGYLAVIEVEHDATDANAPLIAKGTDGMSQFQS